MPDLILINGDKANFNPAFGPAIVVVRPGTLVATGKAGLMGKMVCIDGDEKKVMVPGCVYTTPVYSVPGVGTLKIQSLGGDQKAIKTNSNGKVVLLRGSMFIAKFEVQAPAKMPPPPSIPDSMPMYMGTGTFITTNMKFRGT